jgi:hypothetical protein
MRVWDSALVPVDVLGWASFRREVRVSHPPEKKPVMNASNEEADLGRLDSALRTAIDARGPDKRQDESDPQLRARLQAEVLPADFVAVAPNLVRLLLVDPSLTLVDVAFAVARNRTAIVAFWVEQHLLRRPTAEEISQWRSEPNEARFRFLIVQPYVLATLAGQA